MNKQSVKQEVLRFCQSRGISVNGKGGIPLLSKGDTYLYCADDWKDARNHLLSGMRAIQNGEIAPWDEA